MELIAHYWDYFLTLQRGEISRFLEVAGLYTTWLAWFGILRMQILWHVVEYVLPARRFQPKLRPQLALDLFYPIFNNVLLWFLFGTALFGTSIQIFHDALYALTGVQNLVVLPLDQIPIWAGCVLLFLFNDFLSWAGHVLLHRVGFLWEFHKVHHSSQQLDALNAQRFHMGEWLYWSFFTYIPLGVIGFPPQQIFALVVLGSLLSNFTHANVHLPLGPLKYVLNNPQLHIWHHARSIDVRRNVNYGDSLIVWDFLFGTGFVPDDPAADRREMELAFDGVETYPTTFWGQAVEPFLGMYRSVRLQFQS